MTKAKTNALDSLRALIAERQQYDQWISTLESKRDGTPEHVFNRVYSDYKSRLDRVLNDIRSHSEELQLSINALSSRLTEVARDEDAKRDAIQEAELRAAVGEYDTTQWESLRSESGRELEKIAADRASLEGQLAELESIRKLSEVTTSPAAASASTPAQSAAPAVAAPAPQPPSPAPAPEPVRPPAPERKVEPQPTEEPRTFNNAGWPARDLVDLPQGNGAGTMEAQPKAEAPVAKPTVEKAPPPPPPRTAPLTSTTDKSVLSPRPTATPTSPTPAASSRRKTPTGKDAQIASGFSKPVPTPPEGRPEVNKSLKCPECGAANYPTEWYCEKCGGELATM
ncbi:MAG TPA: hypothetical protein VM099_07215 [Gemmatimonadaceae bacterium]|nr:hypothetical protein [Gemmatimonadaceae bacterium]